MTPRPLNGDIFPIRPGDWLVCENGHLAYEARVTIDKRRALMSADFEDKNGDSPEDKTRALCPICGGDILRAGKGGVVPWAVERAKEAS